MRAMMIIKLQDLPNSGFAQHFHGQHVFFTQHDYAFIFCIAR